MAPAMINPSKWGIFILFRRIGENSMINSIIKNFNTGLVKGKFNSKVFRMSKVCCITIVAFADVIK